MLVIGDSFTQLGYNNFMEYLQDLLPTRTVYGIHTIRCGEEWHYIHKSLEGSDRMLEFSCKTDVILYLLHHAKRLPSTIVIESSERWLMESVTRADFHICEDSLPDYKGAPLPSSTERYDHYNSILVTPDPAKCLINGTAFYFAQNWLKQWKKRPVQVSDMTQPLFTAKGNEHTLYYLPYRLTLTDTDIQQLRSEMAQIIQEGARRKVNIMFMVVPLKEHLYKDFMLSPTPNATYLSDYLEDLQDDPHYLICCPILKNMLEHGQKDLFLCNDTHWSYKGAKACAKELKTKIDRF